MWQKGVMTNLKVYYTYASCRIAMRLGLKRLVKALTSPDT